jgi:predicted nucleic acid-binding protein
MRKTRIYLDSTIPSHLYHDDVPEKMVRTQKLWEVFKTGKYEIIVSEVIFNEVNRCKEPLRRTLQNRIDE